MRLKARARARAKRALEQNNRDLIFTGHDGVCFGLWIFLAHGLNILVSIAYQWPCGLQQRPQENIFISIHYLNHSR